MFAFLMSHHIKKISQKVILNRTRKSSCVTTRGIPPAAYQVLTRCSVLGGGLPQSQPGGYPSSGVAPGWDWGTHVARTGVPPPPGKDLGTETWENTWDWGTPLGKECEVNRFVQMAPCYSTLDHRPGKEPGTGVHPHKQTHTCENITSRCTTYPGGNDFF